MSKPCNHRHGRCAAIGQFVATDLTIHIVETLVHDPEEFPVVQDSRIYLKTIAERQAQRWREELAAAGIEATVTTLENSAPSDPEPQWEAVDWDDIKVGDFLHIEDITPHHPEPVISTVTGEVTDVEIYHYVKNATRLGKTSGLWFGGTGCYYVSDTTGDAMDRYVTRRVMTPPVAAAPPSGSLVVDRDDFVWRSNPLKFDEWFSLEFDTRPVGIGWERLNSEFGPITVVRNGVSE
jgi:hypothetical protein